MKLRSSALLSPLSLVLVLSSCSDKAPSKPQAEATAGSAAQGVAGGAAGTPTAGAPAAGQTGASGFGGTAGAVASAGTGAAVGAAGASGVGAAGAVAGAGGVRDAGVGGSGGQAGAAGAAGAGVSGRGGTAGTGAAGSGPIDASCQGGERADFALVGWAAQNGGTTGGKGGRIVEVSDGAALMAALKEQQDSAMPLTILVSGRITEGNSGVNKIDVKDVRNVSIIGAGAGAELDGIGLKIVRSSNIVIRNLKIHHVQSGDKDALSIEGPADHIWIDHCELYSQYQEVDKDFYDGLLDVKAEAEYITYSWNYLHDSWKAALVGSSEDDTFDRKLTMHHNWFHNCNSRLPLFRGGNGHVFNNYYLDVADTAINARIGACLRVEANYFSNVQNPYVSAYSDMLGAGELVCNVLADGTTFKYADDVRELPSCKSGVPYDYAGVLTHPAQVPAVVMANAGVGKLADPTKF